MWNPFKANNKDISEQRHSDVFLVNFEQISGVSIADFELVNAGFVIGSKKKKQLRYQMPDTFLSTLDMSHAHN